MPHNQGRAMCHTAIFASGRGVKARNRRGERLVVKQGQSLPLSTEI